MKRIAGEAYFTGPTTALFQGCPPFRVKVSSRSGSVRFCISPSRGMVITVPRGYDLARLPGLIASRREWICRHWERLCLQGLPDAESVPEGGRSGRATSISMFVCSFCRVSRRNMFFFMNCAIESTWIIPHVFGACLKRFCPKPEAWTRRLHGPGCMFPAGCYTDEFRA